MFTIFTLELFHRRSHFDKERDIIKSRKFDTQTDNETSAHKVAQEISREKYEKLENFIMLFPLLVTLLGIIIMTILYKLFY